MSDSNEDKPILGRKPLGIKRTVESGQVQQSFSHGRKNTVVVEVKRRRIIGKPGETPAVAAPEPELQAAAPAPAPAAPKPAPVAARPAPATTPPRQDLMSRQELQAKLLREAEEARMNAMEDARRREEAERLAASEEERRRAEENRRTEEQPAATAPEPAQAAAAAETPAEPVVAVAAESEAAPATERTSAPPPRRFTPVAPVKRPEPVKPDRSKRGGDDRRQSGKLTVTRALSDDDSARARSLAALKRAREKEHRRAFGGSQQPREKQVRDVVVPEGITIAELANRMAEKGADLVRHCSRWVRLLRSMT